MQNSMVMFTFFVLTGISFLGKFGPKNQNCQFELKFGIVIVLLVFTLSILDQKNSSWANFVQKTKIVSLSWNLVPKLIRTCRIQWWCSLFLYLTINILLEKIWSKNLKLFKVKFDTKTTSNMQNQIVVSILSVLD